MKSNYLNGIILCITASITWGIAFPLMSIILQHMDAFAMNTIRYSIAVPFFVFFLIKKEGAKSLNSEGKNKLLLAFFGACGFAGFGFLISLGQRLIGPSGAFNASVMTATMPILGLLVNYFLKKSARPTISSLMCVLLSFIGVVLVITKGNIAHLFNSPSDFIADFLMLLGALCWVLYTNGAEYFKDWSPIKYTTLTIIYGVGIIYIFEIILLLAGIAVIPGKLEIMSVLPELIYIGFVSSFLGILCWNMGNKIITPINGVLFINAVPITAFIYSALHGVLPNELQIIGVSVTVIALILNNLLQRKKKI